MEPVLSVVVPIFDEAESIEFLHRELDAALSSLGDGLEIVLVDDGSRDDTAEILRELSQKDDRVRVVELDGNHGQSAALDAGFRVVRAPVTVTLDADLQNDPADILMLLEQLRPGVDVVNGVRVKRRDPRTKLLSSRIANAVRNWLLGESITDVGCSLRVMRTSFIKRVKLYRGLHRFLPTLLAIEGARMIEVPVSHRPRRYGTSKYGVRDRLFVGLVDLMAVYWMKRRALRYRTRR
jgi:glycosyltransferase involved in cell wall biosynthesis